MTGNPLEFTRLKEHLRPFTMPAANVVMEQAQNLLLERIKGIVGVPSFVEEIELESERFDRDDFTVAWKEDVRRVGSGGGTIGEIVTKTGRISRRAVTETIRDVEKIMMEQHPEPFIPPRQVAAPPRNPIPPRPPPPPEPVAASTSIEDFRALFEAK